jgi:hypothetical protein
MKIKTNIRAGKKSSSINNAVFSTMTYPTSRCTGV